MHWQKRWKIVVFIIIIVQNKQICLLLSALQDLGLLKQVTKTTKAQVVLECILEGQGKARRPVGGRQEARM